MDLTKEHGVEIGDQHKGRDKKLEKEEVQKGAINLYI